MRRRFPMVNPNRFPFNPHRQAFENRINHAFTLFEAGDFLQSAQLFEELGTIAEARSGPRAPRFYMQAGRGYLHANKLDDGMALLEKGRQQFINSGRADTAARISSWLKDELTTLGLTAQAQVVASWAVGYSSPAVSGQNHPPLPLKCASCGAPVHPNEVTWLDDTTAECEYCGSPMHGVKE